MTFVLAGHPAFLFVVGAVACAAGLLFWPVEVIMVGFFTVRVSNYGQLALVVPAQQEPSPNSTIQKEFHKKSRIYLPANG